MVVELRGAASCGVAIPASARRHDPQALVLADAPAAGLAAQYCFVFGARVQDIPRAGARPAAEIALRGELAAISANVHRRLLGQHLVFAQQAEAATVRPARSEEHTS